MEKEIPKIQNESELKDFYKANYPMPTSFFLAKGTVCFLVCLLNLFIAKIFSNNIVSIVSWIAIGFSANYTVYFLKLAWNYFDFNKVAKKILNEKSR